MKSILTNLVTLVLSLTGVPSVFAASALTSGAIEISVPPGTQTTQIDAGFPMGCQITTMLYALKLGPKNWSAAYAAIHGRSDVEKIQSIAKRFGLINSRHSPGQAAFNAQFGSDPNDLPWMFALLVGREQNETLINFLQLTGQTQKKRSFVDELRTIVRARIAQKKPTVAQLLYADPDFAHAVLILGIAGSASEDTVELTVLDPMTGQTSRAIVKAEPVRVVGHNAEGVSFIDARVVPRKGVLLSIMAEDGPTAPTANR